MSVDVVSLAVVTFVHELCTAIWVGGLITLAVTVLPAVRRSLASTAQVKTVMAAVQRKARVLVWASILGLLQTGIVLSRRSPQFQGLFAGGSPYATVLAIKHVLVVVMIALALVRSLALAPRGEAPAGAPGGAVAAGVAPPAGALITREKASMVLLIVNAAAGIVVIALSALAAALASQAVG